MILIEPQGSDDFVSGGYRYQACVFEHLPVEQGRKLTTTAPQLPALIERIRREEPDTCIVVDGLFAELAGKPLPSDTVALLHMVPSQPVWCEQPLHVIATSAATAAAVAGVCRSTSVVSPGLDECFDRDRVPREQGEATQIVCVGTISTAKDQARIVRLLESIQRPWQLALIGSFDPRDETVQHLRRCSQRLPVALQGPMPIEGVAACFARSDLLVSLSQSESFGMAVAEATAAGLPAVALATGEFERFIDHGKNGWLLPRDTEDNAIRALLEDLLSNPAKLESAKAARTRPNLASWPEVAQSFVKACAATRHR